MGLRRCKLSRKTPLRRLECFVLETTARAAADLLDVQANTAALFFHKIRGLIAWKIPEAEPEFGVFACDESYFGSVRKGKRGRGAAEKFVCLAFSNAAARSMRGPLLMPAAKHC